MVIPSASQPHRLPDDMTGRKRRYAQTILCLTPVMVWLLHNAWFPVGIRIVLGALMLLGFIRWTAALVLLLIQFHLYLDLPTPVPQNEFEIVIVLITIVSLMVLSRLRSSQELSGIQSATHLIRSAVGGAGWIADTEESASELKDSGSMREVLWLAARSVVLIAFASMLLQSVPEHESAVREYGLTATGLQTVQIGLLLFCIWVVIALPTRELHWKRMTSAQAGIWLRSQTVSWLHRDMRAIERRRRRLRSRWRRRQLHEMPTIQPETSQKAD